MANQSKAMPSLLKRHKKEDFIPDPYCRVALLEKVSTKTNFIKIYFKDFISLEKN